MEESVTKPGIQTIKCPVCKHSVNAEDEFCTNCGYPRRGTEHEQRIFLLKRNTKKNRSEEANKMLRQASNTLLVIGSLMAVMAIGTYLWGINGALQGDLGTFISNLILGLAFIGLGLWCLKRPLPAIVCGLSLFILVLIANAMVAPSAIFHWLILKVAVILLLSNGIRGALNGEKMKKQLDG